MDRQCSNCRFAGKKQNYDDWPCQRHAPVAERVTSSQDLRMWVPQFPIMRGRDSCGDFEAKSPTPKG
jgi:hypothetical protein